MATSAALEHQLDIIKKVVDEKAAELDTKDYIKYSAIFDDTVSFIKTYKVLLYGGQAIHELMPQKFKIYPKNKLPDIDIFALDGAKVAQNVVKYLKRKGYPLASFTEALHEGTFKVFCQGLPILDITSVPKIVYKRLAVHSVVGDKGLRIVNPQFLRLSMHMILSQANDAFRWEKTFKRLVNFYKVFPPKACTPKSGKPSKVPDRLIDSVYELFQNTEYVVFGHRELEDVLGKKLPFDARIPKMNVFVKDNVSDIATDIASLFDDPNVTISKLHEEDMFVPEHVYILYNKEPMIAIFHANSCLTYVHHNKLNIASIHTILRLYLSILLSPNKASFEDYTKYIECYTNALTIIEQKMQGSRRRLLQEFMTQCYGTAPGVVTLRRERIERIEKK